MFFNFEEFWESFRVEMKVDENGMSSDGVCIEEYCRLAWEHGAFREKTKAESIINFLKKEVMHKASFKNVLKRDNRELKDKLKSLKKTRKQVQKIKWHDVNELPPRDRKGFFSITVLTDTEELAYYDYEYNEWIREYSDTVLEPPNAWCKIPKYEDKLYE